MLLDYVLVALAFLAASFESRQALAAGPAAATAAALAYPLFSALLAFLVARSVERRMSSGRDWAGLVAFFTRTLVLLRAAALSAFVFVVHGAGFGALVRAFKPFDAAPAAAEAVILLPFALGFAASLAALHRVEGGGGGLREFLASRLRGLAALMLMLLAGGATVEILFLEGRIAQFMRANPLALAACAGGLIALAAAGVPLALRAMWSTSPLPPGPIRDLISDFSRSAGFRFSGARVWDTGGADVINAAVAGVLPRLRYVFLTRALCERLEPRDILAVFAHEVGHVKRGHAYGFFGVAACWAGLFLAVSRGPLAPGSAAASAALQILVSAVSAAAFLWMTRRFERDADLFAVTSLGGPDAFCETLWKVAALNGDEGSARSITHSSVRSRADFARRAHAEPAAAEAFARSNRAVVASSVVIGLVGLALAAISLVGP